MPNGNGTVPASSLVTVQGDMQLATGTAAAWNVMKSAAAAQGVNIQIAGPAGAYRSLAVQQAMHDNPSAWNVSNPNLLACVGDSSHGYGDRVDISPASANSWAISHAAGFGFVRDIANDVNHYHYTGSTASPPPQTQGDYDMIHILATSAAAMVAPSQRFVQGADGPLRCLSDGEWALHEQSGAVAVQQTGPQIQALIAKVGIREYLTGTQYAGGIGPLTGRILYGTAAADQTYPKVVIAT